MSRNSKVLVTLLVAGLLIGGSLLIIARLHAQPAVTVTVRIAVTPPEQSEFVAGQARSAKFKYLAGKQAGIKPVLAQRLSVKAVPNSPWLEARVGVLTKDAGQRYAAGFIETLQMLCGSQAKVALVEQTIR